MEMRFVLAAAVIAVLTGTQGCALKPQYLHIDPQVKVKEGKIGNGNTVGLRVSDSRSDRKLGEVGDPDRKMVDVRVDEDPSPAIYERVRQALIRLGFAVQPYDNSMNRTLDIKLLSLQLESVKKPLTFDTELRVEVAAHTVNSTAYYDQQFNVRTRKTGAVPPYEKDSTLLVNTAVSQALEDMLADQELLSLLAR